MAVVRQGEIYTGFADGRQAFSSSGNVGNAASTDGLTIGGWPGEGSGQLFMGEVQEVSIYQMVLDRAYINQYMFQDQPTNEPSLNLKGYFKLGFATNAADRLRNLALAPVPAGTETATTNGPVQFEETNQAGEQSRFDALRNGGHDALTPLSGASVWNQMAFARPTPGVAFDYRFGYSSANSFGGFKLGSSDPYAAGPLGKGWRHTFETRVVPSQDFLPSGSIETLGLMSWDGAIETWDAETDEWGVLTGAYRTRHKEYRGELYFTNNFCEWRTPERLVYRYLHPFFGSQTMRGRLVEIHDYNSNTVKLAWNTVSGVLTQVVDTATGVYSFNYKANLLTNVTFGAWQVNFTYDATNRLVSKSITNTSGVYPSTSNTWKFAYHAANGLLVSIIDPRGNSNVVTVHS